jgi:hypothetical protein
MGAIKCTSLVTQIVDKLGVLEKASIEYLPANHV